MSKIRVIKQQLFQRTCEEMLYTHSASGMPVTFFRNAMNYYTGAGTIIRSSH